MSFFQVASTIKFSSCILLSPVSGQVSVLYLSDKFSTTGMKEWLTEWPKQKITIRVHMTAGAFSDCAISFI